MTKLVDPPLINAPSTPRGGRGFNMVPQNKKKHVSETSPIPRGGGLKGAARVRALSVCSLPDGCGWGATIDILFFFLSFLLVKINEGIMAHSRSLFYSHFLSPITSSPPQILHIYHTYSLTSKLYIHIPRKHRSSSLQVNYLRQIMLCVVGALLPQPCPVSSLSYAQFW